MFISAKVFFDDHTQDNIRLLIRAETELPLEWVKTFKRIVAPLTPIDTGYLRRSIITQVLGNTATVGWRAPYALVQNYGRHTVDRNIITKTQYNSGFGLIPGGRTYTNYVYRKGGGKNFAEKAARLTHNEVPAMWRKIGL